jgi:hypothetical protein
VTLSTNLGKGDVLADSKLAELVYDAKDTETLFIVEIPDRRKFKTPRSCHIVQAEVIKGELIRSC